MKTWLTKPFILLGALLVGIPAHAASPSDINSWRKRYYLDKQIDPVHLNTVASFIGYLMRQAPAEKTFNYELELVKKYFPTAPTYLHLALIKVYKNAFLYAHKSAVLTQGSASSALVPSRCAWKQALFNYYEVIYPLLNTQAQTYGYGWRKGRSLPNPDKIRKRLSEDLPKGTPVTCADLALFEDTEPSK
jgi:hypothetical protein